MRRNHWTAVIGVAAAITLGACSRQADDTRTEASKIESIFQHFLTVYEGKGPGSSYADGSTFEDHSRLPQNLEEWRARFIPPGEPTVRALYRNTRELGFVREMTCTKRFSRGGPGGCMVTNWHSVIDADREDDLGTVAMSITSEGYARFSTFFPKQDGFSQFAVDEVHLDSERNAKANPDSCVHCHGGSVDGRRLDLGSVFREFEPSLLEATTFYRPELRPHRFDWVPVDHSQRDAEQEWYELNQAIVAANATLRSEAEGGQPGIDHAKQAIADHVREIYDGLGEPKSHPSAPFSRRVDDPALMPPSWQSADAASQELWTTTVSGYCMECHRINSRDFSRYGAFSYLRRPGDDGRVRLHAYLHGLDPSTLSGITNRTYPYMPQAEVTWEKLAGDSAARNAITAWAGPP